MSQSKYATYKRIAALLGGLWLMDEIGTVSQNNRTEISKARILQQCLSESENLEKETARMILSFLQSAQLSIDFVNQIFEQEQEWIHDFKEKCSALHLKNDKKRKEFRAQGQSPRSHLEKWNDFQNRQEENFQAGEEFLWKLREIIFDEVARVSPQAVEKIKAPRLQSDIPKIKRLSKIMESKINNVLENSAIHADQIFLRILELHSQSSQKGYWYRTAKKAAEDLMADSWKYGEKMSTGQLNWKAFEKRICELKRMERRKRCAIETFISAAVLTDKQKELASLIANYPGDFYKLIYHDAQAREEIMRAIGYVKLDVSQPFQCGDVERFSYRGKTPQWAEPYGIGSFLPSCLLQSNSHRRILYNGLVFSDGLEGQLLKDDLARDPISTSFRKDHLRSFDYEQWRPDPQVYGRIFSSHMPPRNSLEFSSKRGAKSRDE